MEMKNINQNKKKTNNKITNKKLTCENIVDNWFCVMDECIFEIKILQY